MSAQTFEKKNYNYSEWAKGRFSEAVTLIGPGKLIFLAGAGSEDENGKGGDILHKGDFATTGVLSSLLGPLAKAGISAFALSTFDTDYLLLKSVHLNAAYTRSWFQNPNSFDAALTGQDQRAQIKTYNIAPTWNSKP